MPVYVSLLRAINVGGKRIISMEALRDAYSALGFEGVQSYAQSGNVLFSSDDNDGSALVRQIKEAVAARAGFDVTVILRTREEMSAIVGRGSPEAQRHDPRKFQVMFLADAPAESALSALLQRHAGPETLHVEGQEIYLYYPDGAGRSKLTGALIERTLGVSGTPRNWNTVTNLNRLADHFDAR